MNIGQKDNILKYIFFKTAPFICPNPGCSYETKTKGLLLSHYGVTHKAVFKHYNRVMGLKGEGPPVAANNHHQVLCPSYGGRGGGTIGRPRGSYSGRAAARAGPPTQPCLICEEYVSPETMVFHLAHKHFQVNLSKHYSLIFSVRVVSWIRFCRKNARIKNVSHFN